MNKLVSVVIPVYNVEKYLQECLDSVILQTYTNLEIILVDDGSTDSSGDICDQYAVLDDRINVIHQKNGGLSAARNAGMDIASGEFIYFLDSDDYLELNAIERLVITIEEEKAEMVFFDAYVIYSDCEKDVLENKYRRKQNYQTQNGETVFWKLYNNEEYRTPVQLYFYNLSWLKREKIRFYEGIIHEDELFTFQAFMADGTVAHCYEELYARRIRPASIMTSSSIERRFFSIITIYLELEKMYRTKRADGKVAGSFISLFARSVDSKYKLLSEEQQIKYLDIYQEYRKSVVQNKGFGDLKLLEKCSSGWRKKYYHLKRKVFQKKT